MKKIIVLFLFFTTLYGGAQQDAPSKMQRYMDMISADGLSSSLHFLASDHFEGRGSGTVKEKLAAQYLASCYKWMGVPALKKGNSDGDPLENYFQRFTYSGNVNSQNVIAVIEGSDPVLKKEAIIVSAHYDHLGRDTALKGDQVFNGAADDGSGTVALLQVAKSFAEAKKNGAGPRRTVIFLHTGAEEKGLRGSNHYAHVDPIWPLEKTIAVVNMDGVGGFDIANLPGNTNYVYLLAADSTSAHLLRKAKQLNGAAKIGLDLPYPKNPEKFGSDHQPFEAQLVPAIYFTTGLTEHYHKVSDSASTVDYIHMAKITKLVFALSWDIANTTATGSTFDRNQYVKTGEYFCPPCGCSKDGTLFDKAGICEICRMTVSPVWKKKN